MPRSGLRRFAFSLSPQLTQEAGCVRARSYCYSSARSSRSRVFLPKRSIPMTRSLHHWKIKLSSLWIKRPFTQKPHAPRDKSLKFQLAHCVASYAAVIAGSTSPLPRKHEAGCRTSKSKNCFRNPHRKFLTSRKLLNPKDHRPESTLRALPRTPLGAHRARHETSTR